MAYPRRARGVKRYGGVEAYRFSCSRVGGDKGAVPGVASSVARVAVASRSPVVAHPEVAVGSILMAYPGGSRRVKRYGGVGAHVFTHSLVCGHKDAVPGVASSVARVAVASRTNVIAHPEVAVGSIVMAYPGRARGVKSNGGPLAHIFTCSRVCGDKG